MFQKHEKQFLSVFLIISRNFRKDMICITFDTEYLNKMKRLHILRVTILFHNLLQIELHKI